MLRKKTDVESIIRQLSKKKLNATKIRKRLKSILSKKLVPSIRVLYFIKLSSQL
jgi:hypothetical protein